MTNAVGVYRVYKNNELVSESKNLITDNGKDIIHQYLSGAVSDWASTIGIGAFDTTAYNTDFKLKYEITRVPIVTRSAVDSVIVPTTISGSGTSYLVGVSSSTGLSVGQVITGTGINASATVTVTAISGSTVTLSHPNTSTVSGNGYFRSPKSVRFKGTLPEGIECRIYELGIFTSVKDAPPGAFDEKILTNFDEGIGVPFWNAGTLNSSYGSTYYPRLGTGLLKVTATTSAQYLSYGTYTSSITVGSASSPAGTMLFGTSEFSNGYDTAKLLVYTTAAASITVKAQDTTTVTTGSADNFVTLISTSSVGAGGPYVLETAISKGNLYNDTISKIEITYSCPSGTADIYLDSLKFSSTNDFGLYYGMVSRSVLSTPIVKDAKETVDIEYEIYLYP